MSLRYSLIAMARFILRSICCFFVAIIALLSAWHPASLHAQPLCPPGNLLTTASTVDLREIYEPQLLNDGILTNENSNWSSSRAAIFQSRESFIVFDLGVPRRITGAVLQGDNNDTFYIEGSLNGTDFSSLWQASVAHNSGIQLREGSFDGTTARFIRLTAKGGDDFVSASELALYCEKQEGWRSELQTLPGEPRVAPPEFRQGAGATFWLCVWGTIFLIAVTSVLLYRLGAASSTGAAYLPKLRSHLKEVYLTLDYHTLGVFRISIGLLLLCDLFNWVQSFDLLFSVDGLLSPRLDTLGESPFLPLTLLRWSTSDWSTGLFMAFSFLTYIAFTLGYRTCVTQPLAWICAMSIQNAAPMLNNSGHMVIRLLLTWTLVLPLGRRFSIDAVRHSGSKTDVTPDTFTSILALILPIQLSAIYFFNVLHKFSAAWTDGSFVSLVLQDPSIATGLGASLVEWVPTRVLSAATILTLVVEAAGPFLLLSPVFSRRCRVVAVVCLICLHVSIGLCMKLTIFSWAMISFLILMLPGETAKRIGILATRRTRQRMYDAAPCAPPENRPSTPLTWPRMAGSLGRTALIVLFGLASLSQLIRENEPLSVWFPHQPVKPLQNILQSLNTYQGWCMFATCGKRSNPPASNTLVLEAIDSRGQRIDLLRSIFRRTSVPAATSLMSVQEEPSNEQWRLYERRVAERNPAVLNGLSRYLTHFPYSQFGLHPPLRIEAYSRYQPLFLAEKGYPPLVIRLQLPAFPTFQLPPSANRQ